MNLDKIKSKEGIWYEDANGNYIPFSASSDEIPENAVTEHVCFPLEIRETIRSLRDCDGNKITNGGSFTSRCHIGGGNSPVIMAMVQSGDFTLSTVVERFACSLVLYAAAYGKLVSRLEQQKPDRDRIYQRWTDMMAGIRIVQ